MTGYHNPDVLTVDISAKLGDGLQRLAEGVRRTHKAMFGDRPGWYLAVALPPPRRRTHAADRTRSPRWRAGSRRTKKLARAARRQGRRTPFASPLKGWTDMGWMEEGVATS